MNNIINICTYNVMLTVPKPIRFNGQFKRSCEIPHSIDIFCQKHFLLDIIVFTELIDPICRKILLEKMKNYGWVFSSDMLYEGNIIPGLKLVNGGVVIVSRYEILSKKNYVFKGSCEGYDCYASKGIVYCRINKNGNIFNIFGTHLQAWDTPLARKIRHSQARQCRKFIDSFCLAHDEAVILTGDLNIDFYTRSKDIQKLSKTLCVNVMKANPDTFQFSSDPNTNKLVGNDDANMYKTHLFPNGCYQDYMQHMFCLCCPQELLDYICVSKNHLIPYRSNVFVYKLKAKKKFTMHFNVSTQREVNELSDHYPLIAQLAFSPTPYANRVVTIPMQRAEIHSNPNKYVIFFICLLIIYNLIHSKKSYL